MSCLRQSERDESASMLRWMSPSRSSIAAGLRQILTSLRASCRGVCVGGKIGIEAATASEQQLMTAHAVAI
jgi:hypothetical protein